MGNTIFIKGEKVCVKPMRMRMVAIRRVENEQQEAFDEINR